MFENHLNTLKTQTLNNIKNANNPEELDSIRISIFGKKGQLTEVLKKVGNLSAEDRPKFGKLTNVIKQDIKSCMDDKHQYFERKQLEASLNLKKEDITLPTYFKSLGNQHVISQVISDITDIFSRLGFCVKEGPEIENDFYNFEALNIPDDHPAKDMHDTFYLSDGYLLRTHTSPVQIRTMLKEKPPIRILAPGKVYRCDADTSHSPIFHQIEGLLVDQHVTFSELKGILTFFLKEFFGNDKKIRFRPSYFPFTEPSTEVDVEFHTKKGPQWLEILGAGMVNRNVFRSVNYDPSKFTGLAFGLGIERMAMIKYNIPDIRIFYENDCRFLNQF
ncbi:phenylalanine--tRNA ligase subunit alpha [Candidatus Marinamargulisbacteria bacterium SCGC AG-410-N11]|nr:phenylalanine--tRNA ligase subunit alpha [Candidatus Marinamargulisbacteria bacterium SCGC AG-410-N11]